MAVTVVEESTGTIGSAWNVLGTMWAILTSPWLWLAAAIVGIVIIIIYFRKKAEDLELQHHDIMYEEYVKNTRDATLNAQPEWIRRRRNWLCPLLYKDVSVRVLNYQQELIGYYRGHFVQNDGTLILQIYKTKSWIIFEDKFLLKIPLRYTREIDETRTIEGKEVVIGKKQKVLDFEKEGYVQWIGGKERPREIRISCSSIELYDAYYRVPVFVTSEGVGTVDLRQMYGKLFSDMTTDKLLMTSLKESVKAIRESFNLNPSLGYEKRAPNDDVEVEE